MGSTVVFKLCALSFFGPLATFSDRPSPTGAVEVQTPYHTEQEWIVSSVCRNAFELLAYDKDKKGEAVTPGQVTIKELTGDPLTYDVTVRGAHVTAEAKLQWPGSLWSPAAYLPFCQAAAQALQLPPAGPATAQGTPLHTLLDYSEASIEAENHRVSQWLAAQPDNAAAQEQAALVVGTLAMKENSGYFWDPRDECNHVAAHLAVAQFLRAGAAPSVEGRLADCLVGLIVDTKTQTGHDLDQLAAEKAAPPDLAAWLNACRMRNTRDWRLVKDPASASPLEQVEYVRAYCEAVNPDLAMGWLQSHSIPNRVDWGRIILETGFSVDAGHAFAESSVATELHTMQATFPGSFDGTTLVDDLNQPPGDAVNFTGAATGTPTVISRGMWAQFFQRHLCGAIAETGDFFANKWAVPENTQALDKIVDKTFSSLTLYPYLQLVQQHIRRAPATPATALALFTAHPELAPDCLVRMKPASDPDANSLQQGAIAWFSPPVVRGTAYGAMSRMPEAGWDNAQMDQLYAIAPLQIVVAESEVKRLYGTQFTFDQFQKTMGPLLDYYVRVIDQAGDSVGLTFDQRVQLAEKSAAINPDNYYELAQLYIDNHQEEKGAVAYQQWADQAPDRVKVSNNIEWLVNYYYDHGQTDKALALATEAADVYSGRGLQAMMHLQEKMGNLDQAEGYGQKIFQRYRDNGPLIAFYMRHAEKGEAGYQAKLDSISGPIFPQGMKKVTLASFSAAPSTGICFKSTSPSMKAYGLSSDQVVVALDGYAVENTQQYTFVRVLFTSPDMHLIVWDGQAYKEIEANQPKRLFGVPMANYTH